MSISTSLLIPPEAIGLPPKFSSWRPDQGRAIMHAVDSPQRFIVQVAPTGMGKSLSYVSSSLLNGGKSVILTSTKGLQNQLMRDFASVGITDIRGRNSYLCIAENDGTTCDHGPCIADIKCNMKNNCKYYSALRKAQRSKLIVTNYSYWLNQNEHGDGFGGIVDMLICDEAHDAPDIMSSFLTISIDREDDTLLPFMPSRPSSMSIKEWTEWAHHCLGIVSTETDHIKIQIAGGSNGRNIRKRLSKLLRVKAELTKMRSMDSNWICDVSKYRIEFCPVWPAPYCEDKLFLGIDRVLMTSASMCDKTVEMLGLTDFNKIEFQHTFPASNRMLTHIPTVRMNYSTSTEGLRLWLSRIDQILRGRRDRKGIIHTVSYKRQNYVYENSKYYVDIITHKTRGVEEAVSVFKRSKAPSYLVSPSVTTGYDFPYEESAFQIIGKIAYPDSKSKLVIARSENDRDYNSYVAMQQLIQTCGRSVRAKDDVCENLIIDDNIVWFMRRFGHFAPKWFMSAYNCVNTVPIAPKLEIRRG